MDETQRPGLATPTVPRLVIVDSSDIGLAASHSRPRNSASVQRCGRWSFAPASSFFPSFAFRLRRSHGLGHLKTRGLARGRTSLSCLPVAGQRKDELRPPPSPGDRGLREQPLASELLERVGSPRPCEWRFRQAARMVESTSEAARTVYRIFIELPYRSAAPKPLPLMHSNGD
jgi:hypothetical protein